MKISFDDLMKDLPEKKETCFSDKALSPQPPAPEPLTFPIDLAKLKRLKAQWRAEGSVEPEAISQAGKCLGIPCDDVRYENDGFLLFCGHLEKAVIDLPKCPKGKWKR
ncbi:hypothetical protein [Desulfonema magnum]|nr:hypothetical protein [Desulfonema magnum]